MGSPLNGSVTRVVVRRDRDRARRGARSAGGARLRAGGQDRRQARQRNGRASGALEELSSVHGMRCHRVRLLTATFDSPFNSMKVEYHSRLGRARHGWAAAHRSATVPRPWIRHGAASFVMPEKLGVAMFMVVALIRVTPRDEARGAGPTSVHPVIMFGRDLSIGKSTKSHGPRRAAGGRLRRNRASSQLPPPPPTPPPPPPPPDGAGVDQHRRGVRGQMHGDRMALRWYGRPSPWFWTRPARSVGGEVHDHLHGGPDVDDAFDHAGDRGSRRRPSRLEP